MGKKNILCFFVVRFKIFQENESTPEEEKEVGSRRREEEQL